MTSIQKLSVAYGVLFIIIAVLGYVPGLTSGEGLLFNLFALDLYDNSLHFFSGVWALIAGFKSHKQATLYLKLFGTVYFLDGVLGLFLGNAFLDFGIFLYGIADNTFVTNFFLNVPHIIIGGIASFAGFRLSRSTTGV